MVMDVPKEMANDMGNVQDLLTRFGGNGKEGSSRDDGQPYALCYLRCSSGDSDEQAQRADIITYAERHAIAIPEDSWYADRGAKANDHVSRKEFWRMVERAKSERRVKWILVREDSRFYRNKTKARQLKDELRQHGVTVVNVTSPYDADSASGTLIESINETLPEVNSRQVRDWTINRMRHHCQQLVDPSRPELGRWKNGGPAAFGYRIERRQRYWDSKRNAARMGQYWVLDDTENAGRPCHEWLRIIGMDWYVGEGLGYSRIVDRLNNVGVKPVRSQHWGTHTISQMTSLSSLLTYAGHYIWGKHKMKWLGERVTPKNMPMEDWLIVEEAHQAILTVDEVAAILDVKERRAKKFSFGGSGAASHDSPYLFTGGLSKCKACDSNIVGMTRNRNGRRYEWYSCGSWAYRSGAGCAESMMIPRDLLESTLWKEVKSNFPMSRGEAAAWANKVNDCLKQQHETHSIQDDSVTDKLKTVECELSNVVSAVKAGGSAVTALIQEAQDLERRKTALEQRLEDLKGPREAAPKVNPDDILHWWNDLEGTMTHGTNEDRRAVVRGFVKDVSIDPVAKQVEVTLWRWEPGPYLPAGGSPDGIC